MASPSPYKVIITTHAERDLKGLPLSDAVRIRLAIDNLASGLAGRDIQKLQGRESEWRLRVGDWRIFFTYLHLVREIHILGVKHRREAYR